MHDYNRECRIGLVPSLGTRIESIRQQQLGGYWEQSYKCEFTTFSVVSWSDPSLVSRPRLGSSITRGILKVMGLVLGLGPGLGMTPSRGL